MRLSAITFLRFGAGLTSMLIAASVLGQPARPVAQPADQRRETLELSYIANEGVLLSSGAHRLLIDALFDKPNEEYRPPSSAVLEKIMKGEAPFDGVDLLLVTHNHPDHFDAALVARYLAAFPASIVVAPADAVAELRKTAQWSRIERRVVSLDIQAGEKKRRELRRIGVTAMRTLHSGDRDSPMNLMYLVELGGWRIFHEGDSATDKDKCVRFALGEAPVDLALVHFWFPLDPACARYLQEDLHPDHVGLMHLPIRLEQDAPAKIEMVKPAYKDLFLMLPGMPRKTFSRTSPSGASLAANSAQTLLSADAASQ